MPDELKRLKELADQATPGPWKCFAQGHVVEIQSSIGAVIAWPGFDSAKTSLTQQKKDATFIVASREAMPMLLSENTQLQAQVAALTQVRDTLVSAIRCAIKHLEVPQLGYPTPVEMAHETLERALVGRK